MKRNKRLILDIGSANISIYGDSLILREPNIAVVKRGNGLELIAAGNEAFKLLKKPPEHSYVVRPMDLGAVVNPEAMRLTLKYFFNKVFAASIYDKYEIYCIIPCGLSIVEREAIENSIIKAKYRDVTLIESPLGVLPYTNGLGTAVAVLGAGVADIAVLDKTGIITGLTVNLGGDVINNKIKETVLEKYNLKISWSAAERIKKNIGTLYENDTSLIEVVGQDIIDQQFRKVEVKAEYIRPCITHAYKRYVEIIESTLTTIPNKILGEVSVNGLILVGGGADMSGATDFFARYLRLPVKVVDSPETALIKGVAKLVKDNTGKYNEILGNKR